MPSRWSWDVPYRKHLVQHCWVGEMHWSSARSGLHPKWYQQPKSTESHRDFQHVEASSQNIYSLVPGEAPKAAMGQLRLVSAISQAEVCVYLWRWIRSTATEPIPFLGLIHPSSISSPFSSGLFSVSQSPSDPWVAFLARVSIRSSHEPRHLTVVVVAGPCTPAVSCLRQHHDLHYASQTCILLA